MKVFYAIKIEDEKINVILNTIKVMCDHSSKNDVHITIRGPYKQRYNISNIEKIANNSKMKFIGVDKFFTDTQNTIYIKLYIENIEKMWYKPSYDINIYGINPHMTLYDGDSRNFATSIYKIIENFDIKIDIDKIKIETIISGEKKGLLIDRINYNIIKKITNIKSFDKEYILRMSYKEKMSIIKLLFQHLFRSNEIKTNKYNYAC